MIVEWKSVDRHGDWRARARHLEVLKFRCIFVLKNWIEVLLCLGDLGRFIIDDSKGWWMEGGFSKLEFFENRLIWDGLSKFIVLNLRYWIYAHDISLRYKQLFCEHRDGARTESARQGNRGVWGSAIATRDRVGEVGGCEAMWRCDGRSAVDGLPKVPKHRLRAATFWTLRSVF